MQAYDILMLVVLAAAVAWGAWKGLAWQLASLASIVLSYAVALKFRQPLGRMIDASPPWNVFLAMLILFLATGLVVWVGFNLVSELIERVKLKEFDRQLGALFGAAKGVLLCVLITLFSVALLGDGQRQAICNSRSGYYIAILLDRADAVIPHELHQVLGPYIDRFDRDVGHPHTANGRGSGQLSGPWSAAQDGLQFSSGTQPARSDRPADSSTSNFPTGEFSGPAAPPPTPQTAGRIEAKPVQSGEGRFRRW